MQFLSLLALEKVLSFTLKWYGLMFIHPRQRRHHRQFELLTWGLYIWWRIIQLAWHPVSQHPSIPASQYPSIPASKYPSIPASKYPSIPASQYPSIPVSQYPAALNCCHTLCVSHWYMPLKCLTTTSENKKQYVIAVTISIQFIYFLYRNYIGTWCKRKTNIWDRRFYSTAN